MINYYVVMILICVKVRLCTLGTLGYHKWLIIQETYKEHCYCVGVRPGHKPLNNLTPSWFLFNVELLL